MNPLDLGVIGIVALSGIFAFARGFVREALSIVAWVGAAIITLYGFSWVYAQVDPRVHNPLLSQVIAGFGLFVSALIVLTIVTGLLARMVQFAGLTPIDRTIGFIFGLLRGGFVVCFAYLLLDASVQPNDRPVWIREAKSAPYLHEGAELLRGFLPKSLKIKSADAVDDALKAINPDKTSPNKTNPDKTNSDKTNSDKTNADKAAADKQARDAMGALSKPAPAPAPKTDTPPAPPNYSPGDKRELDRLIGTQR